MAIPPARTFARLPLLALLLLSAAGPARAQDYALECDVVAGISTLRLTGPPSVGVRSFAGDAKTWVIEIDASRLPGLAAGPRTCVAATAVRVVPGELLGAPRSRIVVRHAGTQPRAHASAGRYRLSWLPTVPPRVPAAPPVARAPEADPVLEREEPAPPESRPVEEERARAELREAARPETAAQRSEARRPAARTETARRPAAVERPAEPVQAPSSLPADYAALGAPARLVVSIPTVVKDGPGRRFETLRRLGVGERVRVQGRSGDWYLLGDGIGWAFATYLESADEAATAAASYLGAVQDVTVPVHEGPGGQHAVVAELYRGQQVVIDELKGEWAHVRNGGWVPRSALGNLEPGQE